MKICHFGKLYSMADLVQSLFVQINNELSTWAYFYIKSNNFEKLYQRDFQAQGILDCVLVALAVC